MTNDQSEEMNRTVAAVVRDALSEDRETPLALLEQIAVNAVKAMAAGFAAVSRATSADEHSAPGS